MQDHYIGALDIGGTKIAAIVAGPEGPLARITAPTPKSGTRRALPEKAIELLQTACRQAGIPDDRIDSIGVASCGPFVLEDGLLALSTPNICGAGAKANDLPNDWKTVPLEQVLREKYSRVVIENDCVAALAGERAFGAVQDEPNCVYVTWSTGIGFGLCVDGRLLRGKHGNAGHAGHMLMNEQEDAVCGCGNRGDIESLISGRNLANRLNMTAANLFNAARDGRTDARQVAAEAAKWFGRTLYNLTATLDTRRFVIGGSVWVHHGEWLAPLVKAEVESRFPALTDGVTITPSGLGTMVTDIGALSLVLPDTWATHWRINTPWQKLMP
ncbi:ROK family protein [Noviherbaspirillum saxi]|uniref:ROK family protein n=1 Tax=Noviherbaspirillum saxi TaxID=2320863 RepID=A0A3A3FKP7_9BURK|nr:ROK family protein [Noviherbaspirillum saxi]RJF96098.1 ROK family protein [Noviherbaspirillum saxi]